ncbi:GntR family transcriptional regulator [Clostridium sp. cel8]|jgi:GntR family transcriptional regulator|uniref:GntR family transcriptional regulator n=1 Tax=Clostridium sp. cel8 TaxID=2663123 RepID=UPI0015F67BAF|nr:GntR family transcriptional regulator [Clostridium sp. cel8]MBA5850279.1 GntR family transcriptional regulator [Clostridium sp. cel8]
MDMEFEPNIPIYKQLMYEIKRKIVLNEIKPGDKLPSIRETSSKFQVNPNTVQRTYQELEREGITYTQRGMGNFVKEDMKMVQNLKDEMASKVLDKFISGMKNIGFSNLEIVDIVRKKLKNIDDDKGEI